MATIAITELMEKWPSNRAFAEDIGLKQISHSRTMKTRGRIPRAYWHAIVSKARKRGIEGVSMRYLEQIHEGIGVRRS